MKKFLPKTSTNTQGFTLVELLVVIAIIAVLSVIAVTIYGSVQKNARDARRREDINAIANALEVAKGSSTNYVVLAGTMFGGGAIPLLDPQGFVYCGNTDTTVPGVLTAMSTATTCTPNGAANFSAISTLVPPAGTYFKVCTYLESGSSYCKRSLQ